MSTDELKQQLQRYAVALSTAEGELVRANHKIMLLCGDVGAVQNDLRVLLDALDALAGDWEARGFNQFAAELRATIDPTSTAPAPDAEPHADAPSIKCPRCGHTSHHPDDVRERYCSACHAWHENLRREKH